MAATRKVHALTWISSIYDVKLTIVTDETQILTHSDNNTAETKKEEER
jgi:hypothetical protein